MIYYFSGTGNSKWIAECLAKGTGDEIQNISKIGDKRIEVKEHGTIGIVCPVYAWTVPTMVEKFAEKLTIPESAYCYLIVTCGEESGKAISKLGKVIPIDSGYSFRMPSNYIVGSNVDSDHVAKEKVDEFKKHFPMLVYNILSKKPVFSDRKGSFSGLKTYAISPLFNKFMKHDKSFVVGDGCDGCGVCEDECTNANIKIVGNKPVWQGDCTLCLACINRCPKNAIQSGSSTKKRGRYYCKEELL